MSVSLQCRSCRATFHIPDMTTGLMIRCPQCGEKWVGPSGAAAEPSVNRANLYPPGMGPAAAASPTAAPSSPLSPARAPSLLSPAGSATASGPTDAAPELPPAALPPTALPPTSLPQAALPPPALPPSALPPMALPPAPAPPLAMGTATMTGPPPIARGGTPNSPASPARPLTPPAAHSPTNGPQTVSPPKVGASPPQPQSPQPPQSQSRGERKSSSSRPTGSPPPVASSATSSSPLAALAAPPLPGVPLPSGPLPIPPPANPPPRTVHTARFIAADPTALKVSLGADGKLPELLLTDVEKAREEAVAKPKSSPPWLMLVVFGFSISISMAMLFVDSDMNVHYERGSHASARAALQANYVGVVPPLAPYQTKIRLALQAYQKGDRDEEKRLYREVLDILKSESKNKSTGVTGMIDSPDPPAGNPSDRHLEALISILLTD